jgi:hypothetical protein
VLEEFTKLFGVKQSFMTAYHPQGNAYAERLHKFFRQAIASYVQDDHRFWDEYLDILVSCYNDSFHEALGVSPNDIVFGQRVGPLANRELQTPVGDFTQLGYVEKQQYILTRTYALVYEKAFEKQQRNAAKTEGSVLKLYNVGQQVLVYRPKILDGESLKLTPHYYGPFTITKVASGGRVYYLKDSLGDHLLLPVSIQHLIEYHPRDGERVETLQLPENSSISKTTSELEEEDSRQSLLLSTLDTQDVFVPPIVYNSQDFDEEEVAVLETLKVPTPQGVDESISSRPLQRSRRKVKRYVVPNTKSRRQVRANR